MTSERTTNRTGVSRAWVAVALVAGLVLAPAAAVATTTLTGVTITGANHVTAAVTPAGQLETANEPPSAIRSFYFYNIDNGDGCLKAYTAPTGYSFILEQVTVDVWEDTSPGPANNLGLAPQSTCAFLYADENPSGVGATVFPFGPGIVIPSGKSLYAVANGDVDGEIYGYGYLVPTADAPVQTPAIGLHELSARGPHQ